jgi:hypothetical protein
LRLRRPVELETVLDTVIIDIDQQQVVLLWRASLPVMNGLQEVAAVSISCPQAWSLRTHSGSARVLPFRARN